MVGPSVRRSTGPGCFTYGCLIAVVIFSVLIGGIWFYARSSMREAVEQYTANTSGFLPSVSSSELDANEGIRKINQLRAAISENRNESVALSSAELQAVIGTTPWKDWIRVELIEDSVAIRFSLPLAALGEWQAASFVFNRIKDRFISGSAKCQISIKQGDTKVSFSELTLNDKKLEDMPRGHASQWVSGAIAELAKEDTSSLRVLKKLKDVSVIDGKLVVQVG
jgi:hypothetical protein